MDTITNLPFDYYDRESILEIGVLVGKSIAVDTCTKDMLRDAFARVCVEIDVTKPLVLVIPIGMLEESD